LLEASSEASHPEDAFQAQVCAAWIHWMMSDPQAALASLPADLERITEWLMTGDIMQWTKVCVIKSVYFKGKFSHKSLHSGY
jgi:cargo-transport protein YPP1